MPAERPGPDYVFVLGRGRSGTTWIGRILDEYARCSYKYEPFNANKPTPYGTWLRDLGDRDAAELRRRFRAITSACFHQIDYPPFPAKRWRRGRRALLRVAWQLGQLGGAGRAPYEWLGRTRLGPDDAVLIKQVNFPNELLPRLCSVLEPRVLAVLRGPLGSVASSLRFYAGRDIKTEANLARVRELLARPELAGLGDGGDWAERLPQLSDAAFEAVRWRVQSEPLVAFVEGYARGHVFEYERVAADAHRLARELYAAAGWPYDDATDAAITRMASGSRRFLRGRRAQHSVYRDPTQTVVQWRRTLDDEQKRDVARVVRDSPLLDRWPDQREACESR